MYHLHRLFIGIKDGKEKEKKFFYCSGVLSGVKFQERYPSYHFDGNPRVGSPDPGPEPYVAFLNPDE
jgi:hypothetical protein